MSFFYLQQLLHRSVFFIYDCLFTAENERTESLRRGGVYKKKRDGLVGPSLILIGVI